MAIALQLRIRCILAVLVAVPVELRAVCVGMNLVYAMTVTYPFDWSKN